MSDETIKKIAKGAGIVFVGTGIGMFFAYLGTLIIARFLGPTDFGLISMASTIAALVSTIVLVGMPDGVARFTAFYKGKNDQSKIKGVIISAIGIVLPLGIIAGIFLFLFADIVSIKVFHDPNLTVILRIFPVTIPFYCIYYIIIYAMGGLQEMKYMIYVRDIFHNGFRFFIILILLYLGSGIYGAAFAYVFTIIITPFVGLYFLKKISPIFNKDIKSIRMKKELFSYSWPLMFAGIIGVILGWTDILMIGYFLTATDVGIYRASLTTASFILIIPGSIVAIFFPIITELHSRGETKELENTNVVVTKWILMLSLPLVLLMILFSKQILYILYGSEYTTGSFVLGIIGLGNLIYGFFSPTSQLISVIGRTKLIMYNTTIGTILNIILNFWLIPIYGINGAAIATAFSLLSVNGLAFFQVYSIYGIHPVRLNYIKILFASTISTVLIYSITRFFFTIIPTYVLVVMFMLYMSFYFIILLITRTFEKQDGVIMKSMEEKSGLRSEWLRNVIGRFL